MAGLIKENFEEELLTELSWIKSVLIDVGESLGVNSFEMELLKNYIQPEEEKAIDKLIALNFNKLKSLDMSERRKLLEEYFSGETDKNWTVPDNVSEKLIQLRLRELTVRDE
ncbi:MAG: hypothetical protein VZR00_06325 [Lachnospiraceae bacterium]|jgi:hypothetical protein|nr:hypothetical protein [Lachnospiraceae bacterium]MEE3461492.1 hypothetical protein [Lachnospiraceae bacterium]